MSLLKNGRLEKREAYYFHSLEIIGFSFFGIHMSEQYLINGFDRNRNIFIYLRNIVIENKEEY